MDVSNGIDKPRRVRTAEQAPVRQDSYFDGNTWQYIGYHLLSFLVCTLTLGIAYPWMLCMIRRWEVKHTVIHGRRLRFDGKGHQLIGRYLLWVLLTLITFGIYGIWLGLGIKKWVVKHTFYADEDSPVESYFSGGAGGFLGIHLLAGLLTGATFGIARAWADVEVLKWEAKHTHIGGSPLEFGGSGGPLFVKYLLLGLLTPLTLGIYAIFWPVMYKKWEVQNTEAVYQTPRIQSQAKAHQAEAIKDYAKFHIAAAEQEIAAIRSGYTGNETMEALEELAGRGNPFACCRLAELLKGDAPRYEDRALALLQTAAKGRLHQALYALAVQLPPEQAIPMLEEAARCGNSQAAWRLTEHYLGTDDLFSTAYWFKLSIEWEYPEAVSRAGQYERLVTDIALKLSEEQLPVKSSHKALKIVLGILGGLLALAIITTAAAWLFSLLSKGLTERGIRIPTIAFSGSNVQIGRNPGDSANEIGWPAEDSDSNQNLPQSTASAEFLGIWSRTDCSEDVLTREIWTLRGDGTAERYVRSYTPVYDDGWFDLQYGGRKWCLQWDAEVTSVGTYTASDDNIVFRFDGIEEAFDISQIDGKLYLGGEGGLVKASPIVGTWGTAVMDSCDTEYDGVVVSESTLETFCLTMEPDGLFSCMDRYYVWINDYNNEYGLYAPAEGTNWGIPAMGFPTVYGTYELSETELVLHLLWDDVGNEYDDYTTFQFQLQPDGTLLLDGWQYYQGCDTLADLCGRFGYPTN